MKIMTQSLCAHTSKLTSLVVSSFLVFTLIGCGPSKSMKDHASRAGTTDGTNNTPAYKLAECNKFQATNNGINAFASTYYEFGRIVLDKINLSITAVPQDLITNPNFVIQFFRWSERKAGEKVTNSIPTKFVIIDRLTANPLHTAPTLDMLTKSSIELAIQKLNASTVTLSNFFERAMLVLQDVGMDYDAIHVASWDSTKGTAASRHDDFLLPAFYANPATYAKYILSTNLQRLHPFYPLINSGGSETDFARRAEEMCAEMIQASNRIPASMSRPSPAPVDEAAAEPGFFKRVWDGFLSLFH